MKTKKKAPKGFKKVVNTGLMTVAPKKITKKEIKEFCKEWGQDDTELADNLGLDVEDDGFAEMAINFDYIHVAEHNVWIPENSGLYNDRCDEIVTFIKENDLMG